ncbi:hypothetical protein HMPREF0322_01556 [Desulfitobacterium hafniense DP7]|uniref:Uncharacterized protein n=1 Tax=Desulfitobacterium hafniense DP7 TaxID=537010 RepID=G9XKU5_DESHA|nr:hypothetical protein HMPREF0322_01556 [Desulfitobacterium hafniense DP7]
MLNQGDMNQGDRYHFSGRNRALGKENIDIIRSVEVGDESCSH